MAHAVPRVEAGHPAAWKASDFASLDDIAFDLETRHLRALEDDLAAARRRGKGLDDLDEGDFRLRPIADDLAAIRTLLLEGRGLLLMRGWPVGQFGLDEIGMMYWGLGAHLGVGVPQSAMGDRLGHVTNVGTKDRRERGYRSSRALDLHTDSDDIVSLLAIRQGRSGGISRLASSMTVYQELAATRPDLLAPLLEGFHCHWGGGQPPGEGPVTSLKVPVFSWVQETFACCYLRSRMEMAVEETGGTFSDLQREALDAFDAMANRGDVALEFTLEPGTASFINNYTTLHARTAYDDWDEPERKRLLLRLWLQARPPRPVHPGIRLYYGEKGSFVDGRTDTAWDLGVAAQA